MTRRVYSTSIAVAVLLLSTPCSSADEPHGPRFRYGVALKEQCLMTLERQYPAKCDLVSVGQVVNLESFLPKPPPDLVLVRTSPRDARGWLPRADVLPIKGVTRQENGATPIHSWSGPSKLETFIGHAWGTYEFGQDGRYVFWSGGDGTLDPSKSGRLYRAGPLLFVDHSVMGPTFLLLTPDRKVCWFAAGETQCAD